jgi:hypothetical protein
MATKITQCPGCKSYNIKELNPDVKKTTMSILCTIICECKECKLKFTIKSGTDMGRRKGVRY